MKRKPLLIATFLVAALAVGGSAQAHDDFGYPAGLLSGVILGLSLDHNDHYYYYRDRPYPYYRHREYRRNDSHGYQHRDRYKHNHGHRDWDKRGSKHRWD